MQPDNSKTVALVSHLTLIGWSVALIMNQNHKTEFGSFYIRQSLGIMLFGFITLIPILGWILGLAVVVLWVISVINAASGKMTPVPVVGEKFQEWFQSV